VTKRTRSKKDRTERREDALRPSRCLGYDRDALAVHLVARGAHEIAACQLRRAIWLNPYEPRFKEHLACCLYKMGDYRGARDWALKALEQSESQSDELRGLLRLIEQAILAAERPAGVPGRRSRA